VRQNAISSGERLTGFVVGRHLDGLDHCLDLFAEVLVGHADDRHVDHLGVGDETFSASWGRCSRRRR
jgi:hypothetical protein